MIRNIITDKIEMSIVANGDGTYNIEMSVRRKDGSWAIAILPKLLIGEIEEFIDVISRMK